MCLTDCLLSDSTLVVLQMKYSTAVECKTTLYWISKYDFCLTGSQKTLALLMERSRDLKKTFWHDIINMLVIIPGSDFKINRRVEIRLAQVEALPALVPWSTEALCQLLISDGYSIKTSFGDPLQRLQIWHGLVDCNQVPVQIVLELISICFIVVQCTFEGGWWLFIWNQLWSDTLVRGGCGITSLRLIRSRRLRI